MELKIELTTAPKELPNQDALGFGRIFTDHMFEMDYEEGKGWHNARIVPHHDFNLNPAKCNAPLWSGDLRRSQSIPYAGQPHHALPSDGKHETS